ncbi:MAG: 3D domain-containing protein [Alphaproteobacteria bacterium]
MKIEKLVVAQDIGSAIKGPIRGDYFWGSGKDDVLEKAGKMNSAGRYFILIPQNKAN